MKLQKIEFRNKEKNYSIYIGEKILKILPSKLKLLCPNASKIALIFDKNIPNKLKKTLISKINKYELTIINFDANEKTKSIKSVSTILNKLLSNNFAIKEAFSKSLGLGFRAPCFPKDISVQRDTMGKPEIFPKNELNKYMKEKFGNFHIHVSLSDTKKYSIASVIIEKT